MVKFTQRIVFIIFLLRTQRNNMITKRIAKRAQSRSAGKYGFRRSILCDISETTAHSENDTFEDEIIVSKIPTFK